MKRVQVSVFLMLSLHVMSMYAAQELPQNLQQKGIVDTNFYDISEQNISHDKDAGNELYSAICNRDTTTIRILLAAGADVNIQDESGCTPLHCSNSAEIAKMLIDAGAHLNIKGTYDDLTPLHIAVDYGYTEKARILIDKGAHLNIQNKSGQTPLHQVIGWHRTEIAKMLIDAGADVNIQDELGYTALYQAVMWNQSDIAGMLIHANADLNLKDKRGYTPLHQALLYNHREIAAMLIDAGAHVSFQDNFYLPAMYLKKKLNK